MTGPNGPTDPEQQWRPPTSAANPDNGETKALPTQHDQPGQVAPWQPPANPTPAQWGGQPQQQPNQQWQPTPPPAWQQPSPPSAGEQPTQVYNQAPQSGQTGQGTYANGPYSAPQGQYGSSYPGQQQPYSGYGQQPSYSPYSNPTQGYAPNTGYGQQTNQYGQFTPPPGMPSKSRKGLLAAIFGGVVAVVVILAVLLFWAPGWAVTKKLDVNAAQDGVKKVLTETYGVDATQLTKVDCNKGSSPKVKKGDQFTCEVTIAGATHPVQVTFKDNDGTYEVGRPTG